MRKIILLIILSFLTLCIKGQHYQTKHKIMELEYLDGSGNCYKITADSIIYQPVTMEMSSSGIYDGGKSVKKTITKKEFEKVKKKFDVICANTNIHIKNRMKTSGQLTFDKGLKDEKRVIIANSAEQKELEKLLKLLLNP